jgi:hypothetical protein
VAGVRKADPDNGAAHARPNDRGQVIGVGRRASAAAPRSRRAWAAARPRLASQWRSTLSRSRLGSSARRPGTDNASPSRSRSTSTRRRLSPAGLRLAEMRAARDSEAAAPGQRCSIAARPAGANRPGRSAGIAIHRIIDRRDARASRRKPSSSRCATSSSGRRCQPRPKGGTRASPTSP